MLKNERYGIMLDARVNYRTEVIMKTRIPFQLRVEVIGFRLNHTLTETQDKFGMSRKTICRIMETNTDIVDRMREQIIADVSNELRGGEHELRAG